MDWLNQCNLWMKTVRVKIIYTRFSAFEKTDSVAQFNVDFYIFQPLSFPYELHRPLCRWTVVNRTAILQEDKGNTWKSSLLFVVFLARWFFLPWWWRRHVLPKRRFLQEPHAVTSQKTAFFRPQSMPRSLLCTASSTYCPLTVLSYDVVQFELLKAELTVPGKVKLSL
jgi:hypothetical protein